MFLLLIESILAKFRFEVRLDEKDMFSDVMFASIVQN